MTNLVLVEDNNQLRGEYHTQLVNAGFNVISLSDGLTLEEVAHNQAIDILVSDTELSGINGDEACRSLLEAGMLKGTLIVGISSEMDFDEYWKGIAHEFLLKRGIVDIGASVKNIYLRFKSTANYRRYKEF